MKEKKILSRTGVFSVNLAIYFALMSLWIGSVQAQKACPLNFYDETLLIAKNNVPDWNGKIVACDVQIVQLDTGYLGKPYYKAKLEHGGEIWVGSLVKSGYEKVGAKLRIIGFFAAVKPDDESLRLNRDGFHILAFAVIDLATKQMAMLPGTSKQIDEWKSGKIPRSE